MIALFQYLTGCHNKETQDQFGWTWIAICPKCFRDPAPSRALEMVSEVPSKSPVLLFARIPDCRMWNRELNLRKAVSKGVLEKETRAGSAVEPKPWKT